MESRQLHERLMARAIELSRRGVPAPNPHVGCVIATPKGEILGEGYHAFAGDVHAEVAALAQASLKAKDADAYVTLEPCNHSGRTPPCSQLLWGLDIKRVFVAVPDPNPLASGGALWLRERGIQVEVGLLQAEAEAENRIWLHFMRTGRPWVTLKAAITSDGMIARADGTSKWITGEESRRRARQMRGSHGAVLVGWKTVAQDNPSLTVRDEPIQDQPLRIIVDPHSRLNQDFKVFQDGLASTWHIDADEWAKLQPNPMEQILVELAQQEIPGLMVEGGAGTYAPFLQAGLVDRIALFQAPVKFGEGIEWNSDLGAFDQLGFELVRAERIEEDVLQIYERGS